MFLCRTITILVWNQKNVLKAYATRMEEAFNQIRTKFPHLLNDKDMETHLRERLFYGIIKALQDSICYLYDNDEIIYAKLLIVGQKAETEIRDSKSGSSVTTAKAKSVVLKNSYDLWNSTLVVVED